MGPTEGSSSKKKGALRKLHWITNMLRPTRGNSSKEKVLELAALDHKQVGSDRRELQ